MRIFRRLAGALLLLFLVAVTLFFILENRQSVALIMFGWAAPALPVSVLVLAALGIGLVIGPLLGIAFCRRARRRGTT